MTADRSVELRKSKRFPLEASVAFSGVEVIHEGDGTLCNLSRGGCAVTSKTVVQTGTYLSLKIHLQDRTSPLLVQLATVRWTSRHRFGLQFLLLETEEQTRLTNLLAKLGEPTPSSRDAAKRTKT
jgi:hypothetical protein